MKENDLLFPKRKRHRLKIENYNQEGAYFITVCNADATHLFWNEGNARPESPADVPLSTVGKIVDEAIRSIPEHYAGVFLRSYVVMPNHIHLLLELNKSDKQNLTNISVVIKTMKAAVTKRLGRSVWQASYYDHIIRNKEDFQHAVEYIENNPRRYASKQ